ncbi:MAG: ParA family protein [Gemmataceae bacterium]|nr:ParA family protein [Gemmataceae bacterium]
MKKLLFASPKAGVGKTTVAIHMAAAAAMSCRRVLLVDCDPLGDAIAALGLASPHATREFPHAGRNTRSTGRFGAGRCRIARAGDENFSSFTE